MPRKLHWRDAYDREHWRLQQQKPQGMNFTGQWEDWDESTREIMRFQGQQYREWEAKVKALETAFAERCKCTCRRFTWLAKNFNIHAWDCPVNDYPDRRPNLWKNRLEIWEARRDKLKERLAEEEKWRCVKLTGQWFNSGLVRLPPLELICPVWLEAHCSLYHLRFHLCATEQQLRKLKLKRDIARLDIKISELAFYGCTCRFIFGLHAPWCPARGKTGIPRK
jgi:hypothetical protein